MTVRNAKFVKSSKFVHECPQNMLPEYAFAGRSNVGKSSLINALTGNAHLCKISATPGKTRLINHFIINDEWYLVDLPGYGYAKTGKRQRAEFAEIILNYLRRRSALTLLFLLIDSRLPPQKIDMDFIQFLGENNIPFNIVFTKIDKISHSAQQKTIQQWQAALQSTWEELPKMMLTSAKRSDGIACILETVEQTIFI
jgi:GTP-binding protein